MRRADRLLKIVHFLRSRRRAVTAQTIAEQFEICTRTVYRDIQDLMTSGAPIIGEAGVGYMIDKDYFLPPVTFDVDEIEALGLGISMVRHWTDDGFAQKALSALDKIQAVLPAALQGQLEQITTYSAPNLAPLPWQVSFSDLRDCMRRRRKIAICYSDGTGKESQRQLRPLAVIFCSPVWLLVAWCETREGFRHFRLDRIAKLDILEAGFADEPDKNLAAYKAQDGIPVA
ncbi:helix-turn-helix transcriptional regulator [Algirhabdus cladophorae]|uniref:helix-turn-helix transcriptional regulator n=1 Tax=Algirhabdus cladophorae TaxID=3377108 RepID=UPI003B84ACBD